MGVVKQFLLKVHCAAVQGKVVVRAGTEGFQSEQGPWSYLGAKALRGGGKAGPYVPDFDAVTTGSCRLLRVTADAYAAALRMGRAAEGRAADHIVGVRAVKQVCHKFQPCPQPYALHLGFMRPRCAWARAADHNVGVRIVKQARRRS